jgi:hypothetical protein
MKNSSMINDIVDGGGGNQGRPLGGAGRATAPGPQNPGAPTQIYFYVVYV